MKELVQSCIVECCAKERFITTGISKNKISFGLIRIAYKLTKYKFLKPYFKRHSFLFSTIEVDKLSRLNKLYIELNLLKSICIFLFFICWINLDPNIIQCTRNNLVSKVIIDNYNKKCSINFHNSQWTNLNLII